MVRSRVRSFGTVAVLFASSLSMIVVSATPAFASTYSASVLADAPGVFDGAGNCSGAVVSLGFSAFATGAGAIAQRRAASALYGVFNVYARDTYLWRQAGMIGGITNGASGIVGLLSSFFPGGDSYEGACC